MKCHRLWVGLLLLCPVLHAQVSVDIALEQEQFLRDESLRLKVRITNRSGQTIKFGQDKDWLTFSIESREGTEVSRIGEMPVEGEMSIESSQVGSRMLDLMPFFDLSRVGRYRVTAMVRIKEWNLEVSSAPKEFDIIRGVKVWDEEFGVPAPAGPPEVRRYALLQANNLKQLRLYARITDATENHVFRVLALGRAVSFSRPEAHVDRNCRLHTLFQTGARSFSYIVISPAGEILNEQVYDYTDTRPVLRGGAEGRIYVAGGAHRVKSDAVAPLPEPAPTNSPPASKP